MKPSNANFAFAGELFEELRRSGVAHVCVCPGSRSAPLAVAAADTPGLRAWSHVDERSAAFFGLGIARATRRPVALVCTSGTAAANFAPALAEAYHARVPLLALTADRPPDARDFGAGQTIRQAGIFGTHLRWFHEAPIPEATPGMLRHARALAARAALLSQGPPAGPVHLNLPFREPLHPVPVEGEGLAELEGEALSERGDGRAAVTTSAGRSMPAPDLVERIAGTLRATPRGVVVCGPLDADAEFGAALARLARALRWPVLADALSGLRSGDAVKAGTILWGYDAVLRDPELAASLDPDCVLRLGDTPTSKATRGWLARQPGPRTLLVDPDGAWQDPDFAASEVLRVDPLALVDSLARALEDVPAVRGSSDWLQRWLSAEEAVQSAITSQLRHETRLYEPHAVRQLREMLPEGATLFVSSSMPIRDVDGFLPVEARRVRILANRGANGIDGIASSALGVAAASASPTVLLTGDLALLHDLGGLLAARRHDIRLTIVVFQNDGGGIFSYLPIADHGESVGFEEHFRVPHGIEVRDIARLFGLGYERSDTVDALRAALPAALTAHRTTLLEVPVDRDSSVAHHRALWEAAARAARVATQ